MSAPTGSVDILVPSESFEGTRARLLRWLKAPGESVSAGEPLVEVETDLMSAFPAFFSKDWRAGSGIQASATMR